MVGVGSFVTLKETTQGESFTADVTLVLVSAPLLRLLVGVQRHGLVGRLLGGDGQVLGLGEAARDGAAPSGGGSRQEEDDRRLGGRRAADHQRSLPGLLAGAGGVQSSSLHISRDCRPGGLLLTGGTGGVHLLQHGDTKEISGHSSGLVKQHWVRQRHSGHRSQELVVGKYNSLGDVLLAHVDEVHHGHHLPVLHLSQGDVDGLLLVLVLLQQHREEGAERFSI